MTDEALKDLVLRHDASITQLVEGIRHLTNVQSNMSAEIKESNQQIKDLMKYLTKQQIFNTKLESMDKELAESFSRVYKRIETVEATQISDDGCSATKLLNKDVQAVTKEMTRLIGICEEHRLAIGELTAHKASQISPTTIKWIFGIVIAYSITFGTYVVKSINDLEKSNIRISEKIGVHNEKYNSENP